ncbi:MAG TPA: porin family protein [Gemmatimonadales bacterium]|nr:porin family protein [Gemmatimonadales bacterium]
MVRRSHAWLLLAGLLGAIPHGVRAQGSATQIGLELGYSRARFQPVGVLDESRDGSLVAGFLSRRIAGPLSGQIELMFSRKGGGLTAVGPNGTISGTVQLVYVEVPVLARLAIPVGRLRPVLVGGGALAISVGCEVQAEAADNIEQQRCDSDSTVSLAGTDFSAVVGGGVEYAMRAATLRLEVRRILGLRDIAAGEGLKNRVWAVLLGITF